MSRHVAMRRGLPSAGVAPPADKRFHRADVRQGRRRRLWPVVRRVAAFLVVGLILLAVGAGSVRAILASRLLAVSHIVVKGTTRMSNGEVEALVDGIRGESILLVDFDQYRKRLMESPWVADVTLWRVLPSTVEVRVVERVPMAVARLGQQLYLVDRTGVIIGEFSPQYREFDLPIVDGLVSAPSEGATPVDPQRVSLTTRFLDAIQARADLRGRVSQLDVSNPRDLVVLLNDDEAFLHLGDDQFVERLHAYLELAPTLRDRFSEIDYVDLRFDQKVFVRSRGQAAALEKKKSG